MSNELKPPTGGKWKQDPKTGELIQVEATKEAPFTPKAQPAPKKGGAKK